MRIVVLGGSVFLSRAVAARALDAGHEVVCVNRSGGRPEGAEHVRWDRGDGSPPAVGALADVDAVVDVARQPPWVRDAVARWPEAHHLLVSSISVYDHAAPEVGTGGGPGRTPLLAARHDEVDLAAHPEAYGPLKVGCEEAVVRAHRSTVLRPGLVVGPGDPTGRFTYWPDRLTRDDDPVLVSDRAARVQVIDVRDLAAWCVGLLEEGRTGVLDAVGPVTPLGALLDDVARGVGAAPTWEEADDDALSAAGVAPWMGPRSLPLWLPRPAHDAMMTQDHAEPAAAGLRVRPIAETAADTLAWLRAERDAGREVSTTGLTAAEEGEVLSTLHP